jgi:hypothetical protein
MPCRQESDMASLVREVDACMAQAEEYRREPRDGDWVHSVANWTEGEVNYHLQFSCRDLSFRMIWLYEHPGAPGRFDVELDPTPGLPVTLSDLGVERRAVVGPDGTREPSAGDIYRMLDEYALPRLFLDPEPPEDLVLFRDEQLLEVALWARKFGHLPANEQIDGELANIFTEYAKRIVHWKPDQQEGPEWLTAVDDVCMRLLFRARPGRGISAALGRSDTFRSYVRRALIGAMRSANPSRTVATSGRGVPQTIGEAATRLGVSFSTVWRRFQQGGWPEWCVEAWKAIEAELQDKRAWQASKELLQRERGMTPEAARKMVQRAKKAGQTPASLLEHELGSRGPSQREGRRQ